MGAWEVYDEPHRLAAGRQSGMTEHVQSHQ